MSTTESPTNQVAPVTYPEVGPGSTPGASADLDLLRDVDLTVTVELGRVKVKVKELLRLGEGSVLGLDRTAGEPVDLLVNGSVIARGEVVVVEDELGVRITELLRRP